MATKFLEPGGDATFDGKLCDPTASSVVVASDFVHGGHLRSFKFTSAVETVACPDNAISGSGGRFSAYFYFNVLPAATCPFLVFYKDGGAENFLLQLTSTGVLQLLDSANNNQIGSNGSTLSAGTWYRISITWKITSTTVNEFRVYLNGIQNITGSNHTLSSVVARQFIILNDFADASFDYRASDIYADDSNALTDTGDIWVTAKRPNANGTTNGFTTQIGAGGSGYGSGHSPQVNERPLSTTNGWSMVGAGSAVTEEYSIEGVSVGDIDITGKTIVDFMGWVYASSLASETASLILANSTSNISLTSTNTIFSNFSGSTTYPGGSTDIGIITTTALTTVSLYECGVLVAFNNTAPPPTPSVSDSITVNENLSISQTLVIDTKQLLTPGFKIIG